jgi:hypothetical protein
MRSILKKWFWINCILLLINIKMYCQVNLIIDQSFEDTISTNFCDATKLKYWHTLDSTRIGVGNSGYYNLSNYCADLNFHLPNNYFFFQYPKSGNGMLHLRTYIVYNGGLPKPSTLRSIMRSRLKSKLVQGKKYCAKINVSPFERQTYFTNGIGIYFDNGQLDTIVAKDSSGQYPFVNPQVQCPFVIDDTLNWHSFSGSFVANGSETFCTIGNFLSDTNTIKTLNPGNVLGCNCSEILIDDVSLIATDISNWLHDTSCAIGDSVYIGLPKYEVPDAIWYTANGTLIDTASGIWVHPTNTVTQYIQTIDVCERIAYDTMTVFAYPLSIDNGKWIMENGINIYPNPAKETFTVQKVSGNKVQLINMYGQVVQQQMVLNGQAVFNVGAMARGMYYVKSEGQVGKVVVE